MGTITEKDVVIILKEQSLMTKAYVIDRYINLLNKPKSHTNKSFISFILSFKDRNIGELVKRINDVIDVNYMPAVNCIEHLHKKKY